MSLATGYAMKKRMSKCAAHGADGCEMCMADGGFVGKEKASGYMPPPEPEADMGEEGIVDRIMKRFAKGGEVEPAADFESNDFDYLDQMPLDHEADETGENSGDEIGDEAQDERDDDVVARAMKSRPKKDRMPRPA